MRKELPHFNVGTAYGGAQEWCYTNWMILGGCAAITACDCSIYFELYKDRAGLYPHNEFDISKQDYVDFAYKMEPYLSPRENGIDKLDIYIDGFTRFLCDHGAADICLSPWDGYSSLEATKAVVKEQINRGWPIPCLTLLHKHPAMDDFVWHWYLLNGYEEFQDTTMVKAVTYGTWFWLDLEMLWSTGYDPKGGLILFSKTQEAVS